MAWRPGYGAPFPRRDEPHAHRAQAGEIIRLYGPAGPVVAYWHGGWVGWCEWQVSPPLIMGSARFTGWTMLDQAEAMALLWRRPATSVYGARRGSSRLPLIGIGV